MARRKINLQDTGRKQPEQQIDQLVREMGSSELGFSPTDQVIYEVELNRIRPDLLQSRHLLPFDLREKLSERRILPSKAMEELKKRAEQGNQLALLILGGNVEALDEEEDSPDADEDKGLLALANSIRRSACDSQLIYILFPTLIIRASHFIKLVKVNDGIGPISF